MNPDDMKSSVPCISASRTSFRPGCALFLIFVVGIATGQDPAPSSPSPDVAQPAPSSAMGQPLAFHDFVDSVIVQERSLNDLMRGLNPILETYIQEEGAQYRFQKGVTPNGDDYFLSRLNLTGDSPSVMSLADEQTWNEGGEKFFVQDPLPFTQAAFAQTLFPDFGHFDRQNYAFEFIRWEVLGEVRCAAIDVRSLENSRNRGFVGRIWAEDRNFGIVRFKGTFTSKGLAKRAYHFDSWRLNMMGDWWIPAYVYTEEWRPQDRSSHKLWFKAQTRVWGYDLRNSSDHREDAKGTEDFPTETTYPSEDTLETALGRLQVLGLVAPEGKVNQILETVVNNILITNNLDVAGVRCRVLLTTPLQSFVIGRTIVISRGLIDVLPDEATLAAVLSHQLAHVILGHTANAAYLTRLASSFPETEIFAALDFHFNKPEEGEANEKGIELFSKSPYKDGAVTARLFLKALQSNSTRFPVLLHGRFSNDFGNIHLAAVPAGADSNKLTKTDGLDQISALPIGSRIVLDPWSDRIEMLNSKPVRLQSQAEKIPFEVTPFYPHLKRLVPIEKAVAIGH